MIFSLFRRDPQRDAVASLYHALAAQARREAFFRAPYGVADTFEGRFELLTLLAEALLTQLAALPDPGPALAQGLSNAIFSGFDDALREIGVSDVGVPKKMNKLASAFLGRTKAFRDAAGQSEAALAAAISRNVLGGAGDGAPLADYFLRLRQKLAETPLENFSRGACEFPPP